MKDKETRELLYRTLAVLYRYSTEIAVLEYPRSIERRSIDIVVRLKNGDSLLVKVAGDVENIPRSELQELANLSNIMGIPSLVVALSKGGVALVEGVVYEKLGLRIVSLETLEDVLSGREQVFIYEGKDCFKLSIDGSKLREKRLEKRLSLGDLALQVGVSRRAIYQYEKGSMEPSIEKGEKLIQLLGEDIVKPIDLFQPAKPRARTITQMRFDTTLEARVARMLEEKGYRLVHAKRTVVDISAAGRSDEKVTITVEHPRERVEKVIEKAYYMTKMAKTAGIDKSFVIAESAKTLKELEKEGIIAYGPSDVKKMVRSIDEEKKE